MTRTLAPQRIGAIIFEYTVNLSRLKLYPQTLWMHWNLSSAPTRLVSVLAMGEGFHNYHHTFPYDYSTSEWGLRLNVTTRFINAMAKLGFAYDLRTASPSVVAARAARTGHPELTRYILFLLFFPVIHVDDGMFQARHGSQESELGSQMAASQCGYN